MRVDLPQQLGREYLFRRDRFRDAFDLAATASVMSIAYLLASAMTVSASGSMRSCCCIAASAFGRSLASSAVAVRTARNTARSVFGLPSIQLFAAIRTEWLYCSWSDIGSGSGLPET